MQLYNGKSKVSHVTEKLRDLFCYLKFACYLNLYYFKLDYS